MKMNLKFIWAFVFCLAGNGVFAQHLFSTFEELCAFADTKNKTAQSGDIKLQQARKAKLAALAAIRNDSIGFVFQFHYLLPEFSCLKNVMIPALKLARYSPREIESRAYERLKLLGLEDQALKPASKLYHQWQLIVS